MQTASLPPNPKDKRCHKSKDDQPYRHDLRQVPSIGPQFHRLPSGLTQMTSGDLKYHQGATQSPSSLPLPSPAFSSSDLHAPSLGTALTLQK